MKKKSLNSVGTRKKTKCVQNFARSKQRSVDEYNIKDLTTVHGWNTSPMPISTIVSTKKNQICCFLPSIRLRNCE